MPVLLIACSDDIDSPQNPINNDQHADVKYAVMASSDIVATVQYRLAIGTYADAENPDGDWAETVPVVRPFNASMFVQFENNSTTTQEYTLMIYVDDELAYSKEGFAAPSTVKNDSAVLDLTEIAE